MKSAELKDRTKRFALRVVRLARALPKTMEAQVTGRQLLRSATSVGANYRAACRGRTQAEFVSKVGIVIEEADEAAFWLELLGDAGIVKAGSLDELLRESNELVAIFTASRITAQKNIRASE